MITPVGQGEHITEVDPGLDMVIERLYLTWDILVDVSLSYLLPGHTANDTIRASTYNDNAIIIVITAISASSPDIIRYQHGGLQQQSETIEIFVLYFYEFYAQIYHEITCTFLFFLCPTPQFLPLSLSYFTNACKYCVAVMILKLKDPKYKSNKSAMP